MAEPGPGQLRDLQDSVASLHQRMDRFYAWASQLQVEIRELKRDRSWQSRGEAEAFSSRPGLPLRQPVVELPLHVRVDSDVPLDPLQDDVAQRDPPRGLRVRL